MKRRRTGRREDEERDDDKAQDELDEGLEGLQQVAGHGREVRVMADHKARKLSCNTNSATRDRALGPPRPSTHGLLGGLARPRCDWALEDLLTTLTRMHQYRLFPSGDQEGHLELRMRLSVSNSICPPSSRPLRRLLLNHGMTAAASSPAHGENRYISLWLACSPDRTVSHKPAKSSPIMTFPGWTVCGDSLTVKAMRRGVCLIFGEQPICAPVFELTPRNQMCSIRFPFQVLHSPSSPCHGLQCCSAPPHTKPSS